MLIAAWTPTLGVGAMALLADMKVGASCATKTVALSGVDFANAIRISVNVSAVGCMAGGVSLIGSWCLTRGRQRHGDTIACCMAYGVTDRAADSC